MFTPVVTCQKCSGKGFRPFLGPLFLECRRCGGTGARVRASAWVWQRIRYGAPEGGRS